MIRTIIIDDEPDALEDLCEAVTKYCSELSVVGAYTDPVAGLEGIQHSRPDLLFLDIQMPGMSGFELLKRITPWSFDVIFVSAFDRYAIKAIRFSAMDYLLKPVDVDELMHAVTRLRERKNKSVFPIQSALHNAAIHTKGKEQLAVSSADGIDFFPVKDIIYCKADSCYTRIQLTGKQEKVVTRVLKDFEDFLSESGFCRVHNSYLINLRHVKRYVRDDGGYVEMTDGHKVDISRRRKDEFLSMLDKI